MVKNDWPQGWSLDRSLSMFGKWDFIQQFWSDPCDAPFSAYALSMFGASLEAFVLLNQLDPTDIFWSGLQEGTGKMRLRSHRKGIKGTKSGRYARVRRAGKILTYDPNEQIGRFIGQFSPLAKRPMPGALGALWLLFNILEFGNYVLFLLEVIVQFLYRWASLLYNSKYCQAQRDAVLLKTRDEWTGAAIFPETTLPLDEVLKIRGPITHVNSTIGVPVGASGILTVSMPWETGGLNPTQKITMRLRREGFIDVLQEVESFNDGENTGEAAISWEITGPGFFAVTYDADQGFFTAKNTMLYAQLSMP